MISVLVVGDIRIYREGLAEILARREGLDVLGTAADVQGLVGALNLNPDVVLVDMNMPESLRAIQELSAVSPGVRVVALGVGEAEEEVISCAEAGAGGFVARAGSLDDLIAAIESAARGELLCTPRIAATLVRRLARFAADQGTTEPRGALTAREREIVNLIDHGLSNKEIAGRLGIELATVKNHVHNLLEKLHVSRRGEAARLIQRS